MRRFIITGAPGAGKTAIIRQLELDGFSVVEEAATDVIPRNRIEEIASVSEPAFCRDGIAAEKCSEDNSCRSLGSSEEAGKPFAIVERAHAKLTVKCAAKPPFVSKTALHRDLLEA